MPEFPLQRPLLPGHYRVLLEPPDDQGDETIVFVSESRRVRLRGHAFREFRRKAVPLLDGTHSFDDIARATADVFSPGDLAQALGLLLDQGLLREGPADADAARQRMPQLNLWHDLALDPQAVQARLAAATVAVVGLAGAGAVAAQALGAAGVGRLRLIETEAVSPADPYLAAVYTRADAGRPRAAVLSERLQTGCAGGGVDLWTEAIDDEDGIRRALGAADFVLCALDGGRSGTVYKLNRVCLAERLPWLAVASAGTEARIGPLMRPPDTACYLCYSMRLVAAAQNPEDAFALQSLLDKRRTDDSPQHESLVFGEAVAGQLGALEVVKALCDLPAPPLAGQLLVLDLLSLTSTRHRVLKKPWCPACQGSGLPAAQAHRDDAKAES